MVDNNPDSHENEGDSSRVTRRGVVLGSTVGVTSLAGCLDSLEEDGRPDGNDGTETERSTPVPRDPEEIDLDPNVEEPTLFMKVRVRLDPDDFEECHLRSMGFWRGHAEPATDEERIALTSTGDGFESEWLELNVRTGETEGQPWMYSAVSLHFGPVLPSSNLDQRDLAIDSIRADVDLALVDSASNVAAAGSLPRKEVAGNLITFQGWRVHAEDFPAGVEWLIDHFQSYVTRLEELGYTDYPELDNIEHGPFPSNGYYGHGPYGRNLSYNPDYFETLGELFARTGYTQLMRGVHRELYENHPAWDQTLVPVADESVSLDVPDADLIPPHVDESVEQSAARARAGDNRTTPGGDDWYIRGANHRSTEGDALSPIWAKLGDEIRTNMVHSAPEELRAGNVEGSNGEIGSHHYESTLKKLRTIGLQITDNDPTAFGVDAWKDLMLSPDRTYDNIPEDERNPLRYYASMRAINWATAMWYRGRSLAVRRHFGPDRLTQLHLLKPWSGRFATGFTSKLPDPFRVADLGAVDILQESGLNDSHRPEGPHVVNLMTGRLFHQAASRHPEVEPQRMHFAPRTRPDAWPQTMMSTLIDGITSVDWYRFIQAAAWEFYDNDFAKIRAHAELSRQLEPLDPWIGDIVDATRESPPETLRQATLSLPEAALPDAQVALLWTESTDVWHSSHTAGGFPELRGTAKALRLNGIRTHYIREYMIEEGELDEYDVLFASQRNVARGVQTAILDWIEAGGTLIVFPGAMTFDEADQEAALVWETLATSGQLDYPTEMPEPLKEYTPVIQQAEVSLNAGDKQFAIPVGHDIYDVGGSGEPLGEYAALDEPNVDYAPPEVGGDIEVIAGSTAGGIGSVFAPRDVGDNAWFRTKNYEGHPGQPTVVERTWEQPIPVETVRIVSGGSRTLADHRVTYRDSNGEWVELASLDIEGDQVAPEEIPVQENYLHTLPEPIETDAIRFHIIEEHNTRGSVVLNNISIIGPAADGYEVETRDDVDVAARRAEYGTGQVIGLGFNPCYSYLGGAAVNTYYLQPDRETGRLYRALAEEGGVEPVVTTNAAAMDAGIAYSEEKALIMLSNHHLEEREEVTVEATFPNTYESGTLLTGEAVELQWEGNTVTVTVPLDGDRIGAVLLE